MKTLSWFVTVSSLLVSPVLIFAHGEDKPGPNGGEIRMPGAFHTEVKGKAREFEVFLLDMEFKNPVVANSTVDARVTQMSLPSKEHKMACRASKAANPPRFVCLSSKYLPADGDILIIKSARGTSKGNEVSYKLPLLSAGAHGKPHSKVHGGSSGSSGGESGVEESHPSSHDSHHGKGHP